MPGDIIDISDDEDTVIRPLRMAKTMQSSKVENLPVAVSDDEDDAFIGSQATDPPSSQDCHIIISDTDSDDDASAPSWSREAKGKARQHSPLPPSSPPNERDSDFDFDYEDDDDDELPDPSKIVGYTSSSPRKRALSSGSSAFMARDEGHSSSSSSGRRSSTSVSRPTKKRKTSEQRDAERAKKVGAPCFFPSTVTKEDNSGRREVTQEGGRSDSKVPIGSFEGANGSANQRAKRDGESGEEEATGGGESEQASHESG